MSETPCFVMLPLDDIIALRGLLDDFPKLSAEVARLRAETDGLRSVQSQIMVKLYDFCRGVSPGTGAHYDNAPAVSCVKEVDDGR